MRNYSIADYPQKVLEYFTFLLEEYNYKLTENSQATLCFYTIYQKDDIRVYLNYDFRDNFYYFDIIRGKETEYPSDHDFENIKAFFELVKKYDPIFDINRLQPNDSQYQEALELNACLLRRYGDKILRGEEWF